MLATRGTGPWIAKSRVTPRRRSLNYDANEENHRGEPFRHHENRVNSSRLTVRSPTWAQTEPAFANLHNKDTDSGRLSSLALDGCPGLVVPSPKRCLFSRTHPGSVSNRPLPHVRRSQLGDCPMTAALFHEQFEALLPKTKELASYAFRALNPGDRDEAVADVCAAAWSAWHGLIA